MAEDARHGSSGMADLEKELTCSICTDVLYQPLVLLDCLHTFCGSCLKEWFSWQAVAAQKNRRNAHPYTCPSCRASVRGTRHNASATSLLDVFLKMYPGKGKSEEEKEEMRKQYKPGDNVLPEVTFDGDEENDSEDERLLQEVRELSMASVDPEAARRLARRNERQRRRQDTSTYRPEELGRRQHPSRWATQQAQLSEARLRQHDGQEEHHVEHQPSLRSLLSASEVDSQEVQEEIMRSILADGVLEHIDLDNLTTEQEEELTERIAQAYRRRQRQRDRSRNRSGRIDEPSPQPAVVGAQSERRPVSSSHSNSNQQAQSRARPPISRPHLFEQPPQSTSQSRSASSHSHRRDRSTSGQATPATRSATDLSEEPRRTQEAERDRRRRASSNTRSITDPANLTATARASRDRASSANARSTTAGSERHPLEAVRQQARGMNNSTPSLPTSAPPDPPILQQVVHPAQSHAAFAPELVQSPPLEPSVSCSRCRRSNIQYDMHYLCDQCLDGHFTLCLSCYRQGQGCNHWFGFGYKAYTRWHQMAEQQGYNPSLLPPHILSARRYTRKPDMDAPYPERPGEVGSSAANSNPSSRLKVGAFCERCFELSNGCYWHCSICLEGAWGFCNTCVQSGRHCTHPLTAVAHKMTMPGLPPDPTKVPFAPLPHFAPESFVFLPVSTDCDLCRRAISPNSTRYHCYECSGGDYDVCQDCYRGLEAAGKISVANGSNGWRRCLQNHRMAVVGFQDSPHGGAQQRLVVRAPVGGWALKEETNGQAAAGAQNALSASTNMLPPDGGVGLRCAALWSRWPAERNTDELAFPKNAEITEAEDLNGEWFWGVYAGSKGLFPGNHVQVLR